MILTGTVEKVIRYYPENCFAIIKVKAGRDLYGVKGTMAGIREGITAEFKGEMVGTKFGPTLVAEGWCEKVPTTEKGLKKYMIAHIRGIGPVLAGQIVETFGQDTMDILNRDPERLREVRGIGPKKLDAVIAAVKDFTLLQSMEIWLNDHDITPAIAHKVCDKYGTDAKRILEENPYRLYDEIHGIGFKKADDVALKMGFGYESPFRIRAGIVARLSDAASDGHTYVEKERLIAEAAGEKYLNVPKLLVTAQLNRNIKKVVVSGEDVFLKSYYDAENSIAERLRALAREMDDTDFPDYDRIEKTTGFKYTDEQRTAIMMAVWSNLLILTGGPGTGKTATTNAIIDELEHRHLTVELAAPTGRAARRMSEVTGHPAQTIHRLLGSNGIRCTVNAENPITANAVIVDECSMIDTLLMRQLLDAIEDGTKLILVGDVDQLPSVGAGAVLKDIIESGKGVTIRLTEIFRQAKESAIVRNSHRINRGWMPEETDEEKSDFYFFRRENEKAKPDKIAELVVDLVQNRIPKNFGIKSEDIQVLSPIRKDGDTIGASQLNTRLQAALNPDGTVAAVVRSAANDTIRKEYRVGDRVMQMRNNYDKEIFNGDIGTVTRALTGMDPDQAVLEATFDGRPVRYTHGDLDELELAYATTVHKSQGSEYPAVVMVVHGTHLFNLRRNLIYTGVTRAKRLCVLVGEEDALRIGIKKVDTDRRQTRLMERLTDGPEKTGGKPEEFTEILF